MYKTYISAHILERGEGGRGPNYSGITWYGSASLWIDFWYSTMFFPPIESFFLSSLVWLGNQRSCGATLMPLSFQELCAPLSTYPLLGITCVSFFILSRGRDYQLCITVLMCTSVHIRIHIFFNFCNGLVISVPDPKLLTRLQVSLSNTPKMFSGLSWAIERGILANIWMVLWVVPAGSIPVITVSKPKEEGEWLVRGDALKIFPDNISLAILPQHSLIWILTCLACQEMSLNAIEGQKQ